MTEEEELELLELEEQEAASQYGVSPSALEKFSKDLPDMAKAAANAFVAQVPALGTWRDELKAKITGAPLEEVVAESQKMARENPASSIAGALGGIGASTYATGGLSLAKKLGLTTGALARLARVAETAGEGALLGAAMNPRVVGGDAASNAAFGAAISGVPAAALEGVAGVAGKIRSAPKWAVRSLQGGRGFEKEIIDDAGKSIGQTLLDEGVLSGIIPPSRDTMRSRILSSKEKTGKTIGDIINAMNEEVGGEQVIGREKLVNEALDRLKLNSQSGSYIEDAVTSMKLAGSSKEGGDLSPQEAQNLKVYLQDRIKSFGKDAGEPLNKRFMKEERDALSRALESLAASQGRQEYVPAKRAYENLSKAEDAISSAIAGDRASRLGWGAGLGIGAFGVSSALNNMIEDEKNKIPVGPLAAIVALGAYNKNRGPQTMAKIINAQKSPINTATTAANIWQFLKERDNNGRNEE